MQFTNLILCSFRYKIPKVQNYFKKFFPVMQFTKLILCSFRDKIPKVQNYFINQL